MIKSCFIVAHVSVKLLYMIELNINLTSLLQQIEGVWTCGPVWGVIITSVIRVHITSVIHVHITSVTRVHITSVTHVNITSVTRVHITSVTRVHITCFQDQDLDQFRNITSMNHFCFVKYWVLIIPKNELTNKLSQNTKLIVSNNDNLYGNPVLLNNRIKFIFANSHVHMCGI